MPSYSGSDNYGRRFFFGAGTAHYPFLDSEPSLEEVPSELKRISNVFQSLGYQQPWGISLDPTYEELTKLLFDVNSAVHEGDSIVVYYTGHGRREGDTFYFFTKSSQEGNLFRTSLSANGLVEILIRNLRASQLLLIIDCCYAEAGAIEVAKLSSQLKQSPDDSTAIFLLSAARSKQEASQGALSIAIAEALVSQGNCLVSHTKEYLDGGELVELVNVHLNAKNIPQTVQWKAFQEKSCRIFPNKRFLEKHSDFDLQELHWLSKARGGDMSTTGWYFTGREKALSELINWLREDKSDGKARIVTGAPGTGKSALLSRLVTLSDPLYRNEALQMADPVSQSVIGDLPENIINVAIHARKIGLLGFATQLARALRLRSRVPDEVINTIRNRTEKTVIIVDALDESDEKEEIVSKLLVGLLYLSNVFLIIGTRPDSTTDGSSAHVRDNRRFRALGEATVEINLDDEMYTGKGDVTKYVELRLLARKDPWLDTPYRNAPDMARKVAKAVADRAKNVFLVAHITTNMLLTKSEALDTTNEYWVNSLPNGIEGAFAQFIASCSKSSNGLFSEEVARAVLLPLAFSAGQGLPWAGIWPALATVMAGTFISHSDIEKVCAFAAAYIIKDTVEGESVYRLFHEEIAKLVRGWRKEDASANESYPQTQKKIIRALIEGVPRFPTSNNLDWSRAHPYVLMYLADLAAKYDLELMGNLVHDGWFLACSHSTHLLHALRASNVPDSHRAASCYDLAVNNFGRNCRYEDRLSYLELSARKFGYNDLANRWLAAMSVLRWETLWARWTPFSAHRSIAVASREVNKLAVCQLNDQLVIVSGGADGAIRVWGLSTGRMIGKPLVGHAGAICAIAVSQFNDKTIVVSCGEDGTIREWDLTCSSKIGDPLYHSDKAVRSIVLCYVQGQLVVVSGGEDGAIRAWDLVTRIAIGQPLYGHVGDVNSLVVGSRNGRQVIVSGGADGTIRIWDLFESYPICQPLRGHGWDVISLALGNLREGPAIVSGGRDGSVRVWDLATGEAIGEPVFDHGDWVRALAVGSLGGDKVIISAGDDGTIRVWDLETRIAIGEPRRGHDGWVRSLAIGIHNGRPIIVSCGRDNTIRVWDLEGTHSITQHYRTNAGWITALTICDRGHQPVIVSGGRDGSICMWDLDTGQPIGKPIHGHDSAIRSVSPSHRNGQPIIVSNGVDGSIKFWNLMSGLAIGERRGQRDWAIAMALSTYDSQSTMILAGQDGVIRTWNLVNNHAICKPLRGHQGWVRSLVVGVKNSRPVIISGGEDGTIRIWDQRASRIVGKPIPTELGEVTSLAIGVRDGQPVIVSGGEKGTIQIWDLDSGQAITNPMRGHDGWVRAVATCTRNGRLVIISGGEDGSIRVWEQNGTSLLDINVGSDVMSLTLSELGNIVVGTNHGLLKIKLNLSASDFKTPELTSLANL